MTEEFAVGVEDADVAVGDEEHDAGPAMGATDADVAELGLVTQGDASGLVDAVVADTEVADG